MVMSPRDAPPPPAPLRPAGQPRAPGTGHQRDPGAGRAGGLGGAVRRRQLPLLGFLHSQGGEEEAFYKKNNLIWIFLNVLHPHESPLHLLAAKVCAAIWGPGCGSPWGGATGGEVPPVGPPPIEVSPRCWLSWRGPFGHPWKSISPWLFVAAPRTPALSLSSKKSPKL